MNGPGDGPGGGTDPGSGTSPGSGTGTGSGSWTVVPLIDDNSDPENPVPRAGMDTVTDIFFASATRGFVLSQGADRSLGSGGAVFRTDGSSITAIAFADDDDSNPPDFVGLEPTPTGFIALADASRIVESTNAGQSFGIVANGVGQQFGGEVALAFRVSATGATLLTENGFVSTTDDNNPGPNTVYETAWAPDAVDPVPAELAPGECAVGPQGSGLPLTKFSTHVSADRNFIAYVALDDDLGPEVCVSTNGGHAFLAQALSVPDDTSQFVPSGVIFTDAMNGLVWFGEATAGSYIKRTSNGGATWTAVSLPSAFAAHELDLPVGFYAPDGQHVFLAGFDHTLAAAVLFSSADGGTTWANVPGLGAAVDAAHGLRIFAGTAIDATHVWLGGEDGLVVHN